MRKTFPEYAGPVIAHLRKTFERAGRGSVADVARALNVRAGLFYERWARAKDPTRRPSCDIGTLLAALHGLDVEPARFFTELAPRGAGGELWESPEPVEERATPATRQAVLLAYRRMRQELGLDVAFAGDDAESSKGSDSPAGRSVEVSPARGAKWLEDLDARRQHQAEAVIDELEAGLDQVEPTLLPRALGIWGSALRTMIELEPAAYLNGRALRLAQAAGDDATVADLLQRRAHVIADAGDHARALALAELAAGIFARIGDQAGEGRALVDAGGWLYYLERFPEATQAADRALDLLPESLPRSRFAAYVGCGLGCLELGDHTRAQRSAVEARALPLGPWDLGKLEWFEGSLCRKIGRLGKAEQHLSEAAEIFQRLHYGITAQVVLELAQVLLEQGRPRDAWQTCKTLRRLVAPLQRDPILGATLAELLRLEAGGLSLDLVKRARAVVEQQSQKDAKARRAWRALAC